MQKTTKAGRATQRKSVKMTRMYEVEDGFYEKLEGGDQGDPVLEALAGLVTEENLDAILRTVSVLKGQGAPPEAILKTIMKVYFRKEVPT